MNRSITALAALAVLALAGCSSSAPAPTVSATVASAPAVKAVVPKPAKPAADAPAQLACGHFTNVMGDFSKGILTTAEMRAKIQEVYDNASVSANKGIPDGATAMLAAVTADDGTAFLTASNAFMTACNALS
jgi:hypothetical protein